MRPVPTFGLAAMVLFSGALYAQSTTQQPASPPNRQTTQASPAGQTSTPAATPAADQNGSATSGDSDRRKLEVPNGVPEKDPVDTYDEGACSG